MATAPKWAWLSFPENESLPALIRRLNMKLPELQRILRVPVAGGGGGAPIGAHYLVDALDATLTNEILVSALGKQISQAADGLAVRGLIAALGTGDDLAAISALGDSVFAPHQPYVPTVRAGTNVTVTRDALGYVVNSSAVGVPDDASQILATQVFGG